MLFNGTWVVDQYDNDAKFTYRATNFPAVLGKPAVWADSHTWVVPRHKDGDPVKTRAALEFINFLYQNDQAWALGTGHISSRTSVLNSTAYAAAPQRKSYADTGLTVARPVPHIANWPAVQKTFGQSLEANWFQGVPNRQSSPGRQRQDRQCAVSAQKLRHGRTGLLALAVPEIGVPYFAELAANVQERAASYGITLLIDQTGGTRDRELLVLEGYRSNVVDGLILSPLAVSALDLEHRGLDFPVVLLGETVDTAGVVHVAIDNVEAARQATLHLAEAGRSSIAAIGGSLVIDRPGPALRRMRGYTTALTEAGLQPAPDLAFDTAGWTRAAGYAAAASIVEQGLRVDALFCFNDLLALGALKALLDHGVRVPDDIAIVGWDDIEDCSYATPTITSVAPDKLGIAHLAVDQLLARIAGEPLTDTELFANFEIVVRQSSARG